MHEELGTGSRTDVLLARVAVVACACVAFGLSPFPGRTAMFDARWPPGPSAFRGLPHPTVDELVRIALVLAIAFLAFLPVRQLEQRANRVAVAVVAWFPVTFVLQALNVDDQRPSDGPLILGWPLVAFGLPGLFVRPDPPVSAGALAVDAVVSVLVASLVVAGLRRTVVRASFVLAWAFLSLPSALPWTRYADPPLTWNDRSWLMTRLGCVVALAVIAASIGLALAPGLRIAWRRGMIGVAVVALVASVLRARVPERLCQAWLPEPLSIRHLLGVFPWSWTRAGETAVVLSILGLPLVASWLEERRATPRSGNAAE